MSCCLKLTLDHNVPWSVNLRREFVEKTIIPETTYNHVLSKRNKAITRTTFIHMMYDESATIVGSRIAIGLLKNNTNPDFATTCSFKIYKVSNDATPWVNTLVKSGSVAIDSDRLFKTTLTDVEVGADQQGDITLLVKATITKGNDTFESSQYFNHIGLTDKVERLRKKVVFLDLTKKSTGEP